LSDGGSSASVRVGGLQDRLLLVPGALTQHAVEAQADEKGNKGKDNDDGQLLILLSQPINIVRLS
jgi:hypothetical protein